VLFSYALVIVIQNLGGGIHDKAIHTNIMLGIHGGVVFIKVLSTHTQKDIIDGG